MNYSDRQLKIFETWKNENVNILINSVAGSGKTTTLLEVLKLCEYKTLFLAFNKSIQTEIQEKIDVMSLKQGKALTMHSLGFSAVRNSYSQVGVNNSKNFELLNQLQKINKKYFKKIIWKDKLKLIYTLMDMNDISRMFLTDNVDELKKHFIEVGKPFFTHEYVRILWRDLVKLRNESYEGDSIEIDFIDMLYIPLLKDLFIPIDPYYLMIDEAQDLSLLQHKIIDKLLSQGSIKKWIAVGDPYQSIYSFAGAFSKSFDLFKKKGNVKELKLDINYRCPKNIIMESNEVYDIITPFKQDDGIVAEVNDFKNIKENSLVICRNTSPLISLYFQLLIDNRKVFIKGDDILKSITRFLKPYNKETIINATQQLKIRYNKLLKSNSVDAKIELSYFEDNYKNFITLSNHFSKNRFEDKVESLIAKLNALFKEKQNAITLSTIHKAKGLEADIVYILNENLIPSKFATTEEQLKQEENLRYVARTRAKKELYYLNLEL